LCRQTTLYSEGTHGMGKRGPSSFKKLDIERAIRSAREAGLEPAMIEIETKDGGTIRVYGDKAVPSETDENTADKKAWDRETAKLKAKPK
jgi:hypothetical protein